VTSLGIRLLLRGGVQRGQRSLLLPDDQTITVAARSVANLVPGRHLALFEPLSADHRNTRAKAA
jgi:hypothetical protein